jgi:hypothetical protein
MKTFTTTKSIEKLLLILKNDPRLQSLDDTTILTSSEEQYPIAFDALIMSIKRSHHSYYYGRYLKLR